VRAVVQRVTRASVRVDGRPVGEIGGGLVVLLGVGRDDGPSDANSAAKVADLRTSTTGRGAEPRVDEAGGAVLLVSQFTLYGDCRKGRRPSFDAAAPPTWRGRSTRTWRGGCGGRGLRVETGEFQRSWGELVNDGPVTVCSTAGARSDRRLAQVASRVTGR